MMRWVVVVVGVSLVSSTPNYDRNLHCPEWSKENNECGKNPRYMWSSCLTSCVQNTLDDDEECEAYAREGECTNNPEYVHIHCPHACSLGIAWNPWTRQQLGISPFEFNSELAHEACESPIDLFSASEVMKNRVSKYINGGHSSVKGLVSTAPSEYLGMLGLVEAILYTLRLHEVILKKYDSSEEVLSKVNDRHNAAKSNYIFISQVEELLRQGYSSDLLMRRMPELYSYMVDSAEALRTIFDLTEEQAESGACETVRGPGIHQISEYFRSVPAVETGSEGVEVSVSGETGATATVTTAKEIELHNGLRMPLIGLGTWQLEGDEASETVYQAVKLGYRLFDTAQAYRNEEQVGAGIARAIKEGVVRREELFICTKLSFPENSGYKKVRELIKQQLSALQVEYIDLYMLHSPLEERVQPQTWKALEDLYSEGVLRAIGVSNFDSNDLKQLLGYAKVKPMIVQNKVDIYHYGKQLDNRGDALVTFAASHQIVVQAYSPFSAYPFMMTPLQDPIIKSMAAKLNMTPAQVLLRWTIQHGLVALPRSSSIDNLRSNLATFDTPPLSASDMNIIDTLQHLVASPVSKVVDM